MSQPAVYSRADLAAKIQALGPWFHDMDLNGVRTAPEHFLRDYPSVKWKKFQNVVPDDLTGWTVLDIGCNAGFYSLEMKRRGAARVVGIDSSERYLAQARLAAEVCKLDIEFRNVSVYDVATLGDRFDLVIFMGVLYHLRHPLLALDLIHEHVAEDWLLFQSLQRGVDTVDEVQPDYDFFDKSAFDLAGYPKLHFVEQRYAHDPTNWWIPNRAATEAMLRSAGFQIEAHPEAEVYLCRRADLAESNAVYPAKGKELR